MIETIIGMMAFMVLIYVSFANVVMFSHVYMNTFYNQVSGMYLIGNVFLAICMVIFYTGFMYEQNEKDKKGTYD